MRPVSDGRNTHPAVRPCMMRPSRRWACHPPPSPPLYNRRWLGCFWGHVLTRVSEVAESRGEASQHRRHRPADQVEGNLVPWKGGMGRRQRKSAGRPTQERGSRLRDSC